MHDRAKQQYMAFLLNLASGKLSTSTVVSEDGATASQALQQVAAYINDTDPANDEIAKDISDTINNAGLVPAGVIDLDFENIPYREEVEIVALQTRFRGASPMPFRASTTLRYELASESPVAIRIYSPSGRLVRDLLNAYQPAGYHESVWDGKDDRGHHVGPGVYFVRLQTGTLTDVRPLIRIR